MSLFVYLFFVACVFFLFHLLTYSSSLLEEHRAPTIVFPSVPVICCPFRFSPWHPDCLKLHIQCPPPCLHRSPSSPFPLRVPMEYCLPRDVALRLAKNMSNPASFTLFYGVDGWCLVGLPPKLYVGNHFWPVIRTGPHLMLLNFSYLYVGINMLKKYSFSGHLMLSICRRLLSMKSCRSCFVLLGLFSKPRTHRAEFGLQADVPVPSDWF